MCVMNFLFLKHTDVNVYIHKYITHIHLYTLRYINIYKYTHTHIMQLLTEVALSFII